VVNGSEFLVTGGTESVEEDGEDIDEAVQSMTQR
jgi:hypothetical protein